MEFLFSKLRTYKLQPSDLSIFRLLENSWCNVGCGVLFTEAGATGLLQKSRSKQLFGKRSERPTNILEKDSTMDVLLGIFQKFRSSYFFKTPMRTSLDGWIRIIKHNEKYWGVLNILFYPKKKKKNSKGKNKIFAMPMLMPMPILMLRCWYRDFQIAISEFKKAVNNTCTVIFLLIFSYILLWNLLVGRLGTMRVSVPRNSSIGQNFS